MRFHKGLVVAMIITLLPGCWDAREIEDRTAVVATAIDTHPEGYEVTVQIPIPMKIVGGGEGGGDGGQEAVEILSGEGSTVSDALDEIQAKSNQDVFFGNNRLILIGEEMAKKGIGQMLDSLRRNPEIRRRQWPVVVKGKAKDTLGVNTKLEQVPMEFILSMLENGIRDGLFVREGLNDLFEDLSNPAKEPVVNYITVVKDDILWSGVAVFRGDRMVGKFDRKVSRAVIHIGYGDMGEPTDASCIKVPGEIVFAPKELKRRVKILEDGEKLRIRVQIDMRGDITERTCQIDLSSDDNLAVLEKSVERVYERRARHTIRRAQAVGSDIFNFGDIIRARHPGRWRAMDWEKEFPDVEVDVNYKVTIRRFGTEAR
ncbi:Ger(x)C family spore germination protein [Desmospora profundinema]|uniref:Spore germination protein KC n=1 Tax=Desmospora profundinema TaxID=1571184 RepID=A0ABU1IR08_9BACL|nr:Ger(x)C family spore germination protein [Desmospora profundinema]MDR6227237.1 spore germination protein KC [Desmospora profundinema]